jgi:hypothetical protein
MYSPKSSRPAEKRQPSSIFLAHPTSSPGPRHVIRPPDYPREHPSPSKRRLASTPSSASLPSTPTRDRSTLDFHQARFESTKRLRDAWAQLAERYACPLDEDDIIDLRDATILKDRGVVRNLNTHINFGDISVPDEPENDASSDAGVVHSEDEDDIDEIDTLSHGPRTQNTLEAQLRRVKPLRDLDSEDEDDLLDFLDAEKRTRDEFGPVDDDFSEDPPVSQDDAEDGSGDLADEVIEIFGSSDEESEEEDLPRTFSTRARDKCEFEDDEDEDELGGWAHDESTAIYEVVRTPAPPDNAVIEIFDTPPSSPPPSSPSSMSYSLPRSSTWANSP